MGHNERQSYYFSTFSGNYFYGTEKCIIPSTTLKKGENESSEGTIIPLVILHESNKYAHFSFSLFYVWQLKLKQKSVSY